MNQEIKQCQNCKKDFTIEPDDFTFYEKIQVPPPTFCPECRMISRFASVNPWNLYKRKCAKCGKSMISIHHPDSPLTVYCMPCWWNDDWDGTEFGRDYDPEKPFFQQLKQLILEVPFQALEAAYLTLVNSEYTNNIGHCKNCYLVFWADFCENASYSTFLNTLKDSLDCHRIKDGELLYECIGMNKSYRCHYSEECDSCVDTWFSRSCFSCTNCFGCVNLRGKSFCIFNEQYTKEEYFKFLERLDLGSRKNVKAQKDKAHDFWIKHPFRSYIGNSLNLNVSGDYIYESKNVKDSFMVSGAEDSRFVQLLSVPTSKDCYDYTGWGNNAQRMYQAVVAGENSSNVKFSMECWPNAINNEYSVYAISSKNMFGCANIKKKEYAILNKTYSKEEYLALREKIIADMEKNPFVDEQGRVWKYGDYLPITLLPYSYNESLAQDFFPKTETEARLMGFSWHKEVPSSYDVTMPAGSIPDKISETDDSIIKEVLSCEKCGSAFKITPQELGFYRRMNIPVPDRCPMCRIKSRFERCAKPKFYERNCAKCGKGIKTSYAPERKEIVYCESCYNAEVV